MIYRENYERYIPIMFSVRERDLVSTIQDIQSRLQQEVKIPGGFRIEWAGQYDQLQEEQKRLLAIVPLSLLLILFLLYETFRAFRYAFLVLSAVPFALSGGILALLFTHTPFSISAAVGVISTLGIAILGGVLIVSSIREFVENGQPLKEAVLSGANIQLRPVLMATMCAALGLLPAAISTSTGAEAQKPLARVVVGGMLTAAVLILILIPILYYVVERRRTRKVSEATSLTSESKVEISNS